MRGCILVCTLNCVVSIVSTCIYYQELHHLHAYPFFTAQANSLMGALLAAFSLCFMPKTCNTSNSWQSWAWLSALLAFQNSLEVLSIPRVGNDDLIPILQQGVVPLSLLLSWQMLHRKYSMLQLLGALLVMLGVTRAVLKTRVWSWWLTAEQHGIGWNKRFGLITVI